MDLDFAKKQEHKPKGGDGEGDYNCWKGVRNPSSIPDSSIPDNCHFFTRTKFLGQKIYTEKRVNYDK